MASGVTMHAALEQRGSSPALITTLTAIASSVKSIATKLRHVESKKVGSTNTFGDEQLAVDVMADEEVFAALRVCPNVATGTSEETAIEVDVRSAGAPEEQYSVAFDPLDGSSIIDANFAVGAIFGVWPGTVVLGRTGWDQAACAIATFGPRTTIAIGLNGESADKRTALEVTLAEDGCWTVSVEKLNIKKEGKVFAPGNLRAAAARPGYNKLVQYYLANQYTLRYTGGMVPDIYHILIKGKGVFCNVPTAPGKAKLRLAYECAPIGLLMVCAGGDACDDNKRPLLDAAITDLDVRVGLCVGSQAEVDRFKEFVETTQSLVHQ